MPTTSILYMLLGAALVATGVLASALADRIRGLRVSREIAPRRVQSAPAIAVIETAAAEPRRVKRETKATAEGADDVIAALIASGFKKPVATEAAWACAQAERTTVEDWTRAALRRCARGAVS